MGPCYLPPFEKSNAGYIRACCKPSDTLAQDISFMSKSQSVHRWNTEADASIVKLENVKLENDMDGPGIMAVLLEPNRNPLPTSPEMEVAGTLNIKADVKHGEY
jgi:hypothetical protein